MLTGLAQLRRRGVGVHLTCQRVRVVHVGMPYFSVHVDSCR